MSLCHARRELLTKLLVAVIFAACICVFDAPAQSPRYTVTDLGAFEPRGVNDVGQVAGRAIINGRGFAVVYDGTLKIINPPESSSSEAYAINNHGQIVGTILICEIVNGECHNAKSRAFIYRLGQFTILGTLGGRDSFGFDIDEAGRAVGNSTTPGPAPNMSGDAQAFFSAGGPLENISAKMGVAGTRVAAVNSVGQITGVFRDTSRSGAFIYDTRDGTFSLFTLAGGPRGLNDHGQIVGVSSNHDGSGRAFLYAGGVMKDLGTLLPSHTFSGATAINNAGQIVGVSSQSWRSREDEHAFIYEGGRMSDLNALIPANSGWLLKEATDINSRGQIVGRGTLNGQGRGFMLTPSDHVMLLTEPGSGKALALDSVTFERDPFTLSTARNFSADGRRRITLFARNVEFVPNDGTLQLVVRAEGSDGATHQLAIEHVNIVPDLPSLTQITVRLPDGLAAGGEFQLSITSRGATSNKAPLSIKATPVVGIP
ncbi:MAG: hypothetical protein LC803_20295 [Acidobacteria bacterium]|nr:hypothetical protein [Acidobacteriota bacterium]